MNNELINRLSDRTNQDANHLCDLALNELNRLHTAIHKIEKIVDQATPEDAFYYLIDIRRIVSHL